MPLFCESFWSVTVKQAIAPPVTTLTVVGDTLTTIAGAEVAVIEAAAVFVPSVTEVEVRVTVGALLVRWKCLN